MTMGAVVLAAGSGTRLGGVAKALLLVDGVTYLERIVTTARTVGVTEIVVVVGPPFGTDVRAAAELLGARVIDNPDPARGMASSVALGFGELVRLNTPNLDSAFLWPVDHPFVTAETLRAIADTPGPLQVAKPTYYGRGGHPPLVTREVWPQLAACTNVEGGARTVIAAMQVVEVPVTDRGVVRDVDVPADLTS